MNDLKCKFSTLSSIAIEKCLWLSLSLHAHSLKANYLYSLAVRPEAVHFSFKVEIEFI